MVRSTSRRAKRQTRWCYRAMDRALEHLLGLHGVFEVDHPQYAEYIEVIAKAQRALQVQLEELHRLAWGRVPGDWYSDT